VTRVILVATAILLGATGAFPADSIGGQNEKPTEITGRVVDLLCAVTGRCVPDCGGGKRVFGILLADGRLVAAIKGPENFAGAQADLAPLCGRTVTLDGLLFENPRMPVYQVQGIKADAAAKEFKPADRFLKEWLETNAPTDEWFRADLRVKELIGRNGVLGIPGLKPKPQ
jgi:hypothetical protein